MSQRMEKIKFTKKQVDLIIQKISRSECFDCDKDINKSYEDVYKWRLPICKICRLNRLDKFSVKNSKDLLKKAKSKKNSIIIYDERIK